MKRLFTTFLIVLSICSIAHATLGRIKGLGVNQIFYNDDQLTDIFPHYLSQYMNNAYIDGYYSSYNGYQYSGGLNFRLLGSNFGIYINKDFPVQFEYQYAKLEKAINIYIAKEGFGLGLDIAMDHYNSNFEPPGESLVETTFGVGGKMGYEMSGFDVSVQMHFATGISTHENFNEKKDNALILKLAARKEMLKTQKYVLYPAIQIVMETHETSLSYPTQPVHKNKISSSKLSAYPGIGLNYRINNNILVIAAASCGVVLTKTTRSAKDEVNKGTREGNFTKFILPKVELGLETYLTKWFTFRAGIKKTFYYDSEKYVLSKDAESKLSYLDSDFSYSFGIGLQFGKYSIDWQIYDDLLWNAPFIVTGKESRFASSLSMKFCFK
ncbi:MAG: hypothetical protein RAP70_06960 [Candidatus Celaenobacter antarcticus]|nr:hypothetical protein [Candidatus Celaenobacter antarcticus]